MEILGIGINELVFIIIIALIVLGPKDMQKAGKTIGKWLRNIVTSDGWKAFQQTSRELRTLPNKLMREANDELNKIGGNLNASDSARTRYGSWDTFPGPKPNPTEPPVSTAAPERKENAAPRSTENETSKDDQELNA